MNVARSSTVLKGDGLHRHEQPLRSPRRLHASVTFTAKMAACLGRCKWRLPQARFEIRGKKKGLVSEQVISRLQTSAGMWQAILL